MGEEKQGRSHVLPLLVIGLITSACGIALGLLINWFPTQASEEGKDIDTLWDVLVIVSVPIFVLVETIVLYSVWRCRMRPGEELKDGPPIHGNTRLEVIWTAIPAIILVALCSYAYVVLHDIEKAEASEMRVRVVGEQFTWTFYYPNPGGKEIASPQLYLPKGKQVKFLVQSKDVLHDFWVPPSGRRSTPCPASRPPTASSRQDRHVPVGMRRAVRARARRDAPERHVLTPGAYDKWFAAAKAKAAGGAAAAPGRGRRPRADGKAIFTKTASPACGSCHTLSDAGATGTIGPDLDKVLKGKDAAFIQQSIEEPAPRWRRATRMGSCRPTTRTPSSRRRSRR
jgi:cytochrome c oxidase subunit 2